MERHRNAVFLPLTREEGPKLGSRASIESDQNTVGVTGVSPVAEIWGSE